MSEFFNINEITGLGKLSRLVQKLDAMFTGPTAGKLSNTKISRRTFFKSALIASGLLLAACGEDEKKPPVTATPTKTPEPTATLPPTPTSTPTAIPEAEAVKTIERKIEYENMRLFVDATNIPVAYEIIDPKTLVNSTGVIFFDWQQREAFSSAKIQMETTGQSQVPEITINDPTSYNSIWNLLTPDEESEEHPWITRLPEDVTEPERLAKYGVRIHSDQSDSAPQLHIRRNAFKPGGLLEPLRLLNENAAAGQQEIFDIFVINSPILSASALTPAQRELLPPNEFNYLTSIEAAQTASIMRFRDAVIVENTGYIQEAEERVRTKKGINGDLIPEDIVHLERSIIRLKQNNVLISSLSPTELWFRFGNMIRESNPTANWSIAFQGTYSDQNNSLIVFPAGDDGVQAKDSFVFSYEKDGVIVIDKMNTINRNGRGTSGGKLLPRSSGSYPRLDEYLVNSSATYQNGQYSYKAQTLGQMVRHEIVHSILLEWLPKLNERGLIDQLEWFKQLTADTGTEGHITFPDDNEFITDELTALTIKQAERYLERKDDDSWYSFVFSIPPNIHNPDGAYMITENQERNGQPVGSIV